MTNPTVRETLKYPGTNHYQDFKDSLDGASLDDVIDLINTIKAELPAGATNAKFDFDEETFPHSNDSFDRVWVIYDRPITQQEMEDAARLEAERKTAQLAYMKAEIARLQGLVGEG